MKSFFVYPIILIIFIKPLFLLAKEDSLCFPIDRIKITPLLDEDFSAIIDLPKQFNFTKKIISHYESRCLNTDDIVSLIHALNQKALQKGYVTSRFGIGAQDLNTRELSLQVQIGRIGNIDYNHNHYVPFFAKDFALKSGDILNLKVLETGMLNLQKMRYLHSTMQIIPTNNQTLSNISIAVQKVNSPLSGQYIFDNGGTLFDGYQNTVLLGYENPFRLSDSLYLYMLGSLPFNGLKVQKNYNLYASLSYSIPIRRFFFENSFAVAFNALEIPLNNFTVGFHGRNINFDSKLSYSVLANPRHSVSFGVGFGSRFGRSYIENEELLVQRNDILQYSLFMQYIFSHKQYKLSTNLSLMHGFSLPNPVIKSFHYLVPVFNLYSSLPFLVNKWRAIYVASIKTQVAQNQLYANDQMLIGGRYTVRGFDRVSFSGQFGILYRNDLAIYFPAFGKGIWQTTFAPSLGFDMGYVRDLYERNYAILPKDGVFLMGGGLGLQTIMKHINLQTWWYFPLYNSYKKVNTQSFFFSIALNW